MHFDRQQKTEDKVDGERGQKTMRDPRVVMGWFGWHGWVQVTQVQMQVQVAAGTGDINGGGLAPWLAALTLSHGTGPAAAASASAPSPSLAHQRYLRCATYDARFPGNGC